MATHYSILAQRIPWTEEPGGLQSMGSQSWTRLKRLSKHTCPDWGGRGWEASPGKSDHLWSPSPTHSYRANAEIAQVRGKAQQEQAAYQASLRKEQLRVDALERTLEQKVTG